MLLQAGNPHLRQRPRLDRVPSTELQALVYFYTIASLGQSSAFHNIRMVRYRCSLQSRSPRPNSLGRFPLSWRPFSAIRPHFSYSTMRGFGIEAFWNHAGQESVTIYPESVQLEVSEEYFRISRPACCYR